MSSVHIDVILGHVIVALPKKSEPGKARGNDLDCQQCFQLRLRLHRVDCRQGSIEG